MYLNLDNSPHRQLNVKSASFALAWALGPDFAVMGFDNLVSEIKPYAPACGIHFFGFFSSGKTFLKEIQHLVSSHPNTCV